MNPTTLLSPPCGAGNIACSRLSRRLFGLATLASLILISCSAPKIESVQPREKSVKTEIILTPAQVSAAMIDTQTAALSNEPVMLQAKGRIVLADDRVWRVGLRTPGLVMVVYAGLGDYVRKGQVQIGRASCRERV